MAFQPTSPASHSLRYSVKLVGLSHHQKLILNLSGRVALWATQSVYHHISSDMPVGSLSWVGKIVRRGASWLSSWSEASVFGEVLGVRCSW